MSYPTPQQPPTLIRYECRRLLIPDYLPLRDILLGVLSEPMYLNQWEAVGDMSPQECADIFRVIFESVQEDCALIGEVRHIATATKPDKWLWCDGSIYNRVDYPELFAEIALEYRIDADTFRVPDLRGRVVVGEGNGYVIGDTGGSEQVTLNTDQIPEHTHDYQQYTFGVDIESVGVPDPTGVGQPTITQTTSSAGGGQPHDNMQPYEVLSAIIYAGRS